MKNMEVFEVVLLRVKPDIDNETFQVAAEKSQQFLSRQPGYLERRLLYAKETGQWMDFVRWASRAQAEEAARLFPTAPENTEFMQALDPIAMTMYHFEELPLA